MHIVDYDKLLNQCHFLACEVLSRQFHEQISRHAAAANILRELGFAIERFKLDGWYAVTIQPQSAQDEMQLYRDHVDYDRASDVDVSSRQIFIGANLHACEIGAIAAALDDRADIWMDEPRLSQTYSNEMLDKAENIGYAIDAYVRQWLWFGDVPQGDAYWDFPLLTGPNHDGQWRNAFE